MKKQATKASRTWKDSARRKNIPRRRWTCLQSFKTPACLICPTPYDQQTNPPSRRMNETQWMHSLPQTLLFVLFIGCNVGISNSPGRFFLTEIKQQPLVNNYHLFGLNYFLNNSCYKKPLMIKNGLGFPKFLLKIYVLGWKILRRSRKNIEFLIVKLNRF